MRTPRFKGPFSIRCAVGSVIVGFILLVLLAWKTWLDLQPIPEHLPPEGSDVRKVRFLDRAGVPLTVTYLNRWNIYDRIPLHELPPMLLRAFIESEDKRFYSHGGVDWLARLHAAAQNLKSLKAVRGASTISEQVVRMLHPRPRTMWSRWMEGIEAGILEKRFTKAEILELYMNQVPYSRQRRGIVQAARLHFDRDPETLSCREILALVVLVRSPSNWNLQQLDKPISRLASLLLQRKAITEEQYARAVRGKLGPGADQVPVEAGHFVRHLQQIVSADESRDGAITTTLDASLQERIQDILDARLRDLHGSDAANGAVLVVDHERDEILAWVNGGGLSSAEGNMWVDAVTAPRQPGSTLKPFLYTLAMAMGWTPATIIDDCPLSEPIGSGLHTFHNYSRIHYGPLRLRDALGNSLNIPAVRAIRFTGTERFLSKLHQLGFYSLNRPHEHYGDGLALGDGEVSLFELVRAYATLARCGVYRPIRGTNPGEAVPAGQPRRLFREEEASLIGDILSDPNARRLEFGEGNLLHFPVQTAVKTGTSSDWRDAWAIGFSRRHTAGVWIGNLDRRPTRGVTGTAGPGLVLRAVFAEINRQTEPKPLYLSPNLSTVEICRVSGLPALPDCPKMQERFAPESVPVGTCTLHSSTPAIAKPPSPGQAGNTTRVKLLQPTPGLHLTMDPHVPDDLEAFAFLLPSDLEVEKAEWFVDGRIEAVTGPAKHRFIWPMSRGEHTATVRVWLSKANAPEESPEVGFTVR